MGKPLTSGSKRAISAVRLPGKWSIRIGVVACLLAGVALFAVFAPRRGPLRVGSRVPQFTLPEMGGGDFSMHDARHHVSVVNFWATWCPPCVMETPSLEKFAQKMRPLGVRVIAVSVDQKTSDLERFVSAYHLTFPILRDPSQALASQFGTYKFPETYIFDRNGRLAEKVIGPADWEDPRMIEFVEALVHWPPADLSESQKTAAGNW
jgi:cytochrome c biogenesis protein CcmG, thiol:disulfide interchange protein DsbE